MKRGFKFLILPKNYRFCFTSHSIPLLPRRERHENGRKGNADKTVLKYVNILKLQNNVIVDKVFDML